VRHGAVNVCDLTGVRNQRSVGEYGWSINVCILTRVLVDEVVAHAFSHGFHRSYVIYIQTGIFRFEQTAVYPEN
jgi:hypothetical protein